MYSCGKYLNCDGYFGLHESPLTSRNPVVFESEHTINVSLFQVEEGSAKRVESRTSFLLFSGVWWGFS
ncbi:unnamed protein product [Periconia digitata]|uniref:Uncharacterized protein n=1 Tax=Periconia digitata TaxID=1303443 RepID=A0A9W4ULC7_9PLEO|nr:unnamed protein product [Periconia digitata]